MRLKPSQTSRDGIPYLESVVNNSRLPDPVEVDSNQWIKQQIYIQITIVTFGEYLKTIFWFPLMCLHYCISRYRPTFNIDNKRVVEEDTIINRMFIKIMENYCCLRWDWGYVK